MISALLRWYHNPDDVLGRIEKLMQGQDPYQLAITHGTWGSLKRDLEDFDAAEVGLLEALRLSSQLNNAEEL